MPWFTFLAMLLPSPKRYSVSFRKQALSPFARQAIRGIMGKLLVTKRISQEEFAAAMATPLGFEAVQIPEPEHPPDDEEGDPEEAGDTSGDVEDLSAELSPDSSQ